MNRKSDHDIYTEYYISQAGSGYSNVYAGPIYQKGSGIGSFLGGLFRSILPILKRSTAVVGAELLKSGANVITDLSHNEPPEAIIKKRGKETINNLSRIAGDHMFGSGYNTRTGVKRRQSTRLGRGGKKSKKNKSLKKKKIVKVKKSVKSKKTKKNPRKRSGTRSKNEIIDIFA